MRVILNCTITTTSATSSGAGFTLRDFDGLFRRYAADLLRFTRRRVASPEIAADLVQEAFVRVMRQPDNQEMRDTRAYLFTTAAHLALDQRRRDRVVPLAAENASELDVIDPTPDAERALVARQELARVEAALAALPARTRMVFEMHRMGGLSQPEIARRLGVSTTLVWRMIQQAYAHLRDALREGDGGG